MAGEIVGDAAQDFVGDYKMVCGISLQILSPVTSSGRILLGVDVVMAKYALHSNALISKGLLGRLSILNAAQQVAAFSENPEFKLARPPCCHGCKASVRTPFFL